MTDGDDCYQNTLAERVYGTESVCWKISKSERSG